MGSFLNVLSLRTLQEKNPLWPPSHCVHCKHKLQMFDLVPLLSYYWLSGKCRYCQKKISWQYPLVEFLTAVAFIAILRIFGWSIEGQAMLVYVSTLIAVCITDFREKLIPHEITYPSILLGIIYSGAVCDDLIKTLAGIGISYILFDFMAFYGLKFYVLMHGDPNEVEDEEEKDAQIDTVFDIKDRQPEEEEEFAVLGGGDAVMAALLAAWLGLEAMVVAVFVGFMVGAVMGGIYLIHDLYRQKLLGKCVKPALIGSAACLGIFGAVLGFVSYLSGEANAVSPWLWVSAGVAAILCGSVFGISRHTAGHSKPFPFGPALAVGGVVAMIYNRWYAANPHHPAVWYSW